MSTEPKTGLDYWAAGIAQPDLIFNDLLLHFGAVGGQATVLDKDLSAPPGSPAAGDTYIVGPAATGTWTGHENDIAYYDTTWHFFTPAEGWRVDVADEDTQYRYSGSGWVSGDAGITALTGDVTASGSGSVAATLATAQPGAHTWAALQTFSAGHDDTAIALPSAPAAGTLRRSVNAVAGRNMPFVTGPNGAARCIEIPEVTSHRMGWTMGPTTAGTYFGSAAGVNAGTAATGTVALTNKATFMVRNTFATVITTQNQQVGIRMGSSVYRGNAAGIGGFFFHCRFMFESIKTGCRAFVGLSNGTSPVASDPSGLGSILGFAFDEADSAWTFMHNDAVGSATKETISGQATLATNNTGFDAFIFCYPNDSVVYYRLDDLVQGTTLVDSSVSSELPPNTTSMSAKCVMSNGTANTAAGDAIIGVNQLVVYTER